MTAETDVRRKTLDFSKSLPRWRDFFTHVIGQVRILKKIYPGIMHFMLFWGVSIQVIGTEVFKRGNSSWQGHVAFYLGETAGRIYVLGGNQSNSVSVTSYPKSKLLGYRTPTTPLNSRTFIGAATAGTGSVAALVETGKSVQEGLQMTGLEWAIVAAGFLGVAGACLALYARRDDWLKKGT